VVSIGNGASGDWVGTGFSFTGASDLSAYTVVVDSTALDVKGTVSFKEVRIFSQLDERIVLMSANSMLHLTILVLLS
jgi:hypothetical protein